MAQIAQVVCQREQSVRVRVLHKYCCVGEERILCRDVRQIVVSPVVFHPSRLRTYVPTEGSGVHSCAGVQIGRAAAFNS